jgi:hypothetical protein
MVHRLILFAMKGIALVATVLIALVLPAVAAADSIVYIKDGNVWLSSPDASKQYQVTSDGGYSSPSQSNDGTIAALHGKQLVRLDRAGHKLSEFNGVGSDLTPNFYGPYEPRISPDGSKIAYWFGQYTSYYSYGCYCYLYEVESRTTWSYSDHFTDPTNESDYYKGFEQPEWLTNDRLLASYNGFWMNLWTWKIGLGHGYVNGSAQYAAQFKDSQGYNFYFGDPALSPDGKKLALTDGGDATNNTRLLVAEVPGPSWVGEPPYANDYGGSTPVEQPVLQCYHETGVIWNPTWSSDSVKLAYSLPDGIHVMDTTNYKTGADCPADSLLIAGGAEPEFGPKDVDLSQKPSAPGSPGGSGQNPNGSGQPTTPAAFALSGVSLKPAKFRAAKAGPAIAKATGSALRFAVSAPAKVTLSVKTRAGKAIRGAIKTAGKPGANKLRFMGRVGGKTLKPGRYSLTLRATPLTGGGAKTTRIAFKIVR